MTASRRTSHDHERRTDVARVVALLRRRGPLTLHDMLDDPELENWPSERAQTAVTAAWSRKLIFVDPDDQLVAI
jgi:hypothetical protein